MGERGENWKSQGTFVSLERGNHAEFFEFYWVMQSRARKKQLFENICQFVHWQVKRSRTLEIVWQEYQLLS